MRASLISPPPTSTSDAAKQSCLKEKGSNDRPSRTDACNTTPTPHNINQQMRQILHSISPPKVPNYLTTDILSEPMLAQAKCLRTVSELKANNVKARWQETTANDGKPLTISITHGANGLVYSAKKAGVLWLTGNVSICLSGGATEITLKNTKATSNVPMLARLALPSTQSAQIVNHQIKLGGGGWGGTFIGQ